MPKSKEAKKAAVKKAAAPAPKAAAPTTKEAAPATKEAAPATKAAAPETKAAAPAKKVAAKKRRELQTAPAQDPPSNLNRYSDPKSNQFRSQPAEGQETPFKEGSNLMTASTVLLSALIMIVY